MIIVAGRLYTDPAERAGFLSLSCEAIVLARKAEGCRDFVVSADPIEQDRVNIFEAWDTVDDLHRFRGSGPSSDIASLIRRADVRQYAVTEGASA